MGILRENFGKRIKQLRKARGLSQENLAEKIDLEPTYLGGVERGERNLTIDNIEKIVNGFGLEAYKLFLFHLETKSETPDLTQDQIADIIENVSETTRKKILRIISICSEL